MCRSCCCCCCCCKSPDGLDGTNAPPLCDGFAKRLIGKLVNRLFDFLYCRAAANQFGGGQNFRRFIRNHKPYD